MDTCSKAWKIRRDFNISLSGSHRVQVGINGYFEITVLGEAVRKSVELPGSIFWIPGAYMTSDNCDP